MANIMKMGQAPGFLGSWDIEGLPGKELILTIEKIVDEKVAGNGQTEICTVIHWTDKNYSPMIANITNKKALCKLYKTTDTEKLKGKSVIIGVEKVKAFGDIHDALRIRKRIPEVKNAPAPKCEECHKEITPYNTMTAEQVAAYTKSQYGKALCIDCGAKAKGAAAE